MTAPSLRPAPVEAVGAAGPETTSFHLADQADLRIAVARIQRWPWLREGSDIDRSMIATIVSELGSNILKYAGRGAVSVIRLAHERGVDIEIRAEDRGPGIADVALALQEHYSTGGTLGLGLPGVRRMADEFWIRSAPAAGTTVFARKRISARAQVSGDNSLPSAGGAQAGGGRWETATGVRPHPGHVAGGDAALAIDCEGGLLLAILDATGHGKRAQAVADQTVALIQRQAGSDLSRLMALVHESLRGSPGAALGLAFVDTQAATYRYLGVGNTRAARLGRRPWRGVSRDGVLGDRLPSPLLQGEALQAGDTLVLWTDGLPELESARLAESLTFSSATMITRRLLADLARPHDDAGCLVLRWLG